MKNGIKQWFSNNKKMLWYMLCFALFGLIDQRRGSAVGEVQMIFNNCIGIVMAMLLLPTLQWGKFKEKVYLLWTPICLLLTFVACMVGRNYWPYEGQWISGVLNLTVWSYLVIYIVREWRSLEVKQRLRQPFFWCIGLMLVLMQLSVHEGIMPMWYLLIFGGFYCIGIKQEDRDSFFQGMLNGIVLWFFVQQIIAFGFRPYDYIRYRGLYSGETQNGLFYMIVYCAFLLKWLYAKLGNKKWYIRFFYFFMAAGCVGFMILTGGRSALLGAVVATLLVYTWYDICCKKSFYRWLLHGCMVVLCIIISFPLVYGCVRYLPTVLHHPIWFEGDYDAETSVHSFDPWDSERYITMEEVLDLNIGRILDAVGVKISVIKERFALPILTLDVKAAELEPGDSPDNPFMLDGVNIYSPMGARKVIYTYFLQRLNWCGHSKSDGGFYITSWIFMSHTHNMFLQVAYDYGILSGILFLGLYLYCMKKFLWKPNVESILCLVFLSTILCFGIFEMVVTSGQITMTLIWILFYCAGKDSREKIIKVC